MLLFYRDINYRVLKKKIWKKLSKKKNVNNIKSRTIRIRLFKQFNKGARKLNLPLYFFFEYVFSPVKIVSCLLVGSVLDL